MGCCLAKTRAVARCLAKTPVVAVHEESFREIRTFEDTTHPGAASSELRMVASEEFCTQLPESVAEQTVEPSHNRKTLEHVNEELKAKVTDLNADIAKLREERARFSADRSQLHDVLDQMAVLVFDNTELQKKLAQKAVETEVDVEKINADRDKMEHAMEQLRSNKERAERDLEKMRAQNTLTRRELEQIREEKARAERLLEHTLTQKLQLDDNTELQKKLAQIALEPEVDVEQLRADKNRMEHALEQMSSKKARTERDLEKMRAANKQARQNLEQTCAEKARAERLLEHTLMQKMQLEAQLDEKVCELDKCKLERDELQSALDSYRRKCNHILLPLESRNNQLWDERRRAAAFEKQKWMAEYEMELS